MRARYLIIHLLFETIRFRQDHFERLNLLSKKVSDSKKDEISVIANPMLSCIREQLLLVLRTGFEQLSYGRHKFYRTQLFYYTSKLSYGHSSNY